MSDQSSGTPPAPPNPPSTLGDAATNIRARATTEVAVDKDVTRGEDPYVTRAVISEPAPISFRAPGFDILSELGRGGMGVVYRARDRRRGNIVALKTMHGIEPAALIRFKQEFRTLADVTHPNLVALYEMIADGDVLFFTMEYVDGVDFLSQVRPERGTDPVHWSGARMQRLHDAFVQLGEGVQFLHDAGKLHRDLKPRNVLVTPQSRVVILDFGLAAELNRKGLLEGTDRNLLGTIPYMSPEQAASTAQGPASDWYSLGVMLFEALTGRLPYRSQGFQIAIEKQREDAPPPRDMAPEVPEDWNALCVGLLQRDPEKRLSGPEFLQRLGGRRTSSVTAQPSSRAVRATLVGRDSHLQALRDAHAGVQSGSTVAVLVSGRSGSGKTTLVQHFLDEIEEGGKAVIFAGQCYQQESVPYKAFDSVVDAMSRYLSHVESREAREILPRDADSLARVFPVLRRVAALVPGRRGAQAPDPRELRRRAFTALRELLGRLGNRRPLIVHIDDLQWGDYDSLALLAELLRPPEPPRMLLIGTYRSEESTASPFLQGLLAGREKLRGGLDFRELVLEPLAPAEARSLAVLLLGRTDAAGEALADVIARESGGNPFFVQELVQQLQAAGVDENAALSEPELTLEAVLWRRINRLEEDGRRLLAVLATAGRPMGQADACRAAGLATDPLPLLASLRGQKLVRRTGMAQEDLLATYHDRIRETVVAHMPADSIKDCHRRLVDTLQDSGHADPEVLAIHYEGAGDRQRAATCSVDAADRAAAALAFDRAARLYRSALDLDEVNTGTRGLREKLADALANAGRGAEAGRAYLALADEDAPADEKLTLRRKASGQYLSSGHVAEGVRIAQDVLAAVGLRWPATPGRALLSLLGRRFQLWWRGFSFRERSESQVPVDDLRRVDTSWSVATGLAGLDPIRGAYFQVVNLLSALRAGEPYRVARALAVEACHVATAGTRSARRTAKVWAAADELARRLGQPHSTGMVALALGVSRYLSGDWLGGIAGCEQAENIFRDQCLGVSWELNTAQAFRLYGMLFAGQMAELRRCCPAIMKEARDRGDLYAVAHLGTFAEPFIQLAAGQVDEARRDLDAIMSEWSQDEFYVQHANALLRQCEIDLYRGDPAAAAERVERSWPAYSRSLILRVQHMRICAWHLRARVELALAARAADKKRLLASAEHCAKKLEREGRTDATGLAQTIRAATAHLRGEAPRSIALLGEAEKSFAASKMRLFGAATARTLGQLLGGQTGSAKIQAVDAWMAEEGIRDPGRMAVMLVAGFGG